MRKIRTQSAHAKCYASKDEGIRTLVCWKSKGHKDAEHYDPSADKRWTE